MDLQKKTCQYCGSDKNLRTDTLGRVYPVCLPCLTTRKNTHKEEKLLKRKSKSCKYCGSTENLVVKSTKKRILYYPACYMCWDIYKKEISKKRVCTVRKRFGVDYPIQSPEIEQRRRENYRSLHGYDNQLQNPETKEKIRLTLRNKTGYDFPMQNPDTLKKRGETNLRLYGNVGPMGDPAVRKKSVESFFKRTGYTNPMKDDSVKRKLAMSQRRGYWDTFYLLLKNKNITPLFSKEEYIESVLNKNFMTYRCLRCNKQFSSKESHPQNIYCGCYKRRSNYEVDIVNWLKSLNISNIEENKKFYYDGRRKFEIDILLPDFNLGIDFHGLYWHSEIKYKRTYHQDKYLFFNKLGISLIQVFENEWLSQQDIVKSIILNKFGMSKRIYARSCKIKEISDHDYKHFLEENHLQGYATASIRLGLYTTGDLVAIASFGKNRFSHDGSYELIRLASLKNHIIVGGFQKLIKFFERVYSPQKITSFVNTRYFSGKGYLSTGFIQESLTRPNYYYFKTGYPGIIYNRLEFQKHKQARKLNTFNPALSEHQNMLNNGYLKIFDAGHLKMTKEILLFSIEKSTELRS